MQEHTFGMFIRKQAVYVVLGYIAKEQRNGYGVSQGVTGRRVSSPRSEHFKRRFIYLPRGMPSATTSDINSIPVCQLHSQSNREDAYISLPTPFRKKIYETFQDVVVNIGIVQELSDLSKQDVLYEVRSGADCNA